MNPVLFAIVCTLTPEGSECTSTMIKMPDWDTCTLAAANVQITQSQNIVVFCGSDQFGEKPRFFTSEPEGMPA